MDFQINFKLFFIFCFLIFVNNVESMPNKSHTFHPHFHFILTQTNCSSDDLKCHNSIKIFNLSLKDDKNSTSVDLNHHQECDGHKYFDAHRKQCVNCSVNCPFNAKIEKKCNQTHDIQCVCNSGFFMTIDSGCKPCSQCEPGWGIWRTCWRSRNTVCRKCPPGTYSGVKTGTLGCILCTKCNSSEVMLEECSGVHDSICIDKQKLIHSSNYTKADNLEEEANRLPVYVGFLIIIILVLVTYFIFQLRIKQIVKSGPNLKSQQKLKQPNAYHNLYNNSYYTQRQYNYNQIIKNDKQFDNNCVYNEIPQSFSVKRYNQLNTSVRRNFEVKLNSESHSWKDLAQHLGYTPESISLFESLGRQHINCVQYFLNDWSKRENGSIHSLLKALHKINRLDCVPIIDPHFRVSPY